MSILTHVSGSIRFDGLPGVSPVPDCGIACSFTDTSEQWDKCNIPCGSEGSLTISTWKDPSGSAALYTVTIFGDLRDYDDAQEIIDYFKRITKRQAVRQACFAIEVGCGTIRTFTWKKTNEGDRGGFVEVT